MEAGEEEVRFRPSQNGKRDDKNSDGSTNVSSGMNMNQLWTQWQNLTGFSASSETNARNQDENPTPPPDTHRRFRTAHEYALAVQQWTWQCQMWNSMNWMYMTSFPMYMMQMMSAQQWQQQQRTGVLPGGFMPMPGAGVVGAPPPPPNNHAPGAGAPQGPAVGGFLAARLNPGIGDLNNNPDIGVRYRIPSLWKRVAAEFIDFFVLFVIKLAVTILTVEYVGIVDIQKYDLDVLLSQNIDYNTAFAMTSELIAMEIINRIFICIFETLCLRRGVGGQIGGTTPGKSLMGLRVILCEQIYDGPGPQMVRVLPASDIGLWNALMRSVIKNFSLAFFFPVCFTVFFFQHNRAAYDIISNCIVVESTT